MIFQIAGGTRLGELHRAAGRNNQDAYAWAEDGAGLVAVVCDGCGSGGHSELGAQLGARMFAAGARARLGSGMSAEALIEATRAELVQALDGLAAAMSGAAGRRATIAEHFLFTLVGVLVDGGQVTPFSLGDGLIVVNGERHVLGPWPDNEPPYLAYALLDGEQPRWRMRLHAPLPAQALRSILIATDGALDLDAGAPGLIDALESDDLVFRNRDVLRRRLVVHARGRGLPDDTTVIVLRPAPDAT